MARKILVHGGVGEPLDLTDGCVKAAQAGMEKLRAGEDALEAGVSAAVSLEDDGRFNAGSGALPGLDGYTIAMEAGLADTRGHLGAVFAIQQVKNPILIARKVAETPNVFLAAEGAINFARKMGFPPYYHLSDTAKQKYEETAKALSQKQAASFPKEWLSFDLEGHWNYDGVTWQDVVRRLGHGTIGAVTMDEHGQFAACVSSGGSDPMLLGRVGDSCILGCGFYVGERGAIAATGIGEYIIRKTLCSRVYAWIEAGMPLQEALDKGVSMFPADIDVGLIGITRDAEATSANKEMPTHVIVEAG